MTSLDFSLVVVIGLSMKLSFWSSLVIGLDGVGLNSVVMTVDEKCVVV